MINAEANLSSNISDMLQEGASTEQVIELILSTFPDVPAEHKGAWKSECKDPVFQKEVASDIAMTFDPIYDHDPTETMPIAGVLVNAFEFHGGVGRLFERDPELDAQRREVNDSEFWCGMDLWSWVGTLKPATVTAAA